MEFANKLALVTGAASGIGAATTRILVARGARVLAADVDKGKLEALSAELGAAVTPYAVDLSQQAQVEAMVADAVKALGGLDIFVSNAGIGSFSNATDLPPEEWRRVMAIDLDATFYAARVALPHLIERRGNIVATASISGMAADYRFTAYNAAKAGLIGLIRNLAIDYAPQGVRVNAVSPGFTLTPLTGQMPQPMQDAYAAAVPMRRAGTPEEMAEAICFLASERASYLTGQNIAVDGGMMAHTGQPDSMSLMMKLMGNAQ